MKTDRITIAAGGLALRENLDLLDPVKHKTARNMTVGLLSIASEVSRISRELELFHNKLQPILSELEEDEDWRWKRISRDRTLRGENE